MSKSHEHARLMLEKAAEDLYVLDLLIADTGAPDAVIGFHAQQAVEKWLKAALTERAIGFARTHDLAALLDLLQDNGIAMPTGADRIPRLTPYAVVFRYGHVPLEAGGAPPLDRVWVADCVREVRAWAEALVGETPN
jgi:HEPN domain-containing protein